MDNIVMQFRVGGDFDISPCFYAPAFPAMPDAHYYRRYRALRLALVRLFDPPPASISCAADTIQELVTTLNSMGIQGSALCKTQWLETSYYLSEGWIVAQWRDGMALIDLQDYTEEA